jgi:hypothetical protein
MATITAGKSVQVEADFIRDWANCLVAQLTRSSCHVDPTRDPEELAVAFFNALARRLPATHRRVLVSREFACPTQVVPSTLREERRFHGHTSR